jgi:hypothetical protein
MSASQIQDFLNVKVPTCDTYGQQTIYDSAYGDTVTRQVYSSRRGVSTPFTCLKDFRADTTNIAPESGICSGYAGATNESAATIIYKVAQSCGISPKVLLVTLQKEQSLVTDDWPWPTQYEKAMGAFCPDTSPCNSGYGGFFKQVYYGANRFKVYGANPTYFNYRANRNNIIYFNPGPCQTYSGSNCTKYYGNKYDSNGNSVPDITYCGSTTVYIANQATADLYIYTPYQPNYAALHPDSGPTGLYGTGDMCSAYGNRNFWRMFNDWFGNTYGLDYYASYYAQSTYPSINPGENQPVFLSYKNNGNKSWYDNTSVGSAPSGTFPVHLATNHSLNRSSAFGATWPSINRPNLDFSAVYEADGTTLAANQHVAQPGQIVKFSFTITAPNSTLSAGTYAEYFTPLLEGSPDGGFNDPGTNIHVTINPVQKLAYMSQSSYPTISAAKQSDAFLKLQNTGNIALYDSTSLSQAPTGTEPVHLAGSNPLNRSSAFGATWPSNNRPALNFSAVYEADGTTLAANQHVAQPGQIVKFSFTFSVPEQYAAGAYQEYFQPILEGIADGYFPNIGISWAVTVASSATVKITNPGQQLNIVSNAPGQVSYTIKNVGNAALSTTTKFTTDSTGQQFKASSWLSNSDISTLPQVINPGETAVVNLPILAPTVSSNQSMLFVCSLSENGTSIPLVNSCNTNISLTKPTYTTSYAGQSGYPSLATGEVAPAFIKYNKTGNKPM